MRFEKGHKTNVKHGASIGGASPEYQCWLDMKARCLNPQHKWFEEYGARGVTVFDEWVDDFEAFLKAIGKRPSPRHSIDRYPDNDGSYVPGNIRWATPSQQNDNRRCTRFVTLDGKVVPLMEVCRTRGLNHRLVYGRIDRGWPAEKAINTPAFWHRPDLQKGSKR